MPPEPVRLRAVLTCRSLAGALLTLCTLCTLCATLLAAPALSAPLPEPGQWRLSSKAEVLHGDDALRKALAQPIEDTDCIAPETVSGNWKRFLEEGLEADGCKLGIVSETPTTVSWHQTCELPGTSAGGKTEMQVEKTEASAVVKSRREWSYQSLITGHDARIRFRTEARWVSATCEKP